MVRKPAEINTVWRVVADRPEEKSAARRNALDQHPEMLRNQQYVPEIPIREEEKNANKYNSLWEVDRRSKLTFISSSSSKGAPRTDILLTFIQKLDLGEFDR